MLPASSVNQSHQISLITHPEEAGSMNWETSISITTRQRYPEEDCIIDDGGCENL